MVFSHWWGPFRVLRLAFEDMFVRFEALTLGVGKILGQGLLKFLHCGWFGKPGILMLLAKTGGARRNCRRMQR